MKRRAAIKSIAIGSSALAGAASLSGNVFANKMAKPLNKRTINLFSKHLQWVGFDEMAKIAADLGFDGLDLTVRPGGHVVPENVVRDLPKAVAAANKYGIGINMITTAIKSIQNPWTDTILKTASHLGIRHYRLGWFSYDEALSIPENLVSFAEALKPIADLNAKYDIVGDYQNHSGTSAGAPVWDIYEMIKDLDTEYLGVQYDIRHAMVEGMKSWPLGLRLLAPRIHTIDIKDFEWVKKEGKWTIHNVPLGKGAVEFKNYFQLLDELEVDSPISLHLEYPLGGAEHGKTAISIPREDVLQAMSRDLSYLRKIT